MEGKIADTVFTFSVEGILSKVASLAAQELSLAWGFKAELRRLGKSLTDIQDLLAAVSDQPQDRVKVVEEWVKKLKGIAHDADDVMDEFDYEVVRRKVELQNHMKKKVLNFFSLSNPLAFRLKMAHKIKNINQSLVDLKDDAPFASFASLIGSKRIDATPREFIRDRQTNSLIGRDEIPVGREDVVSKIVTTLTDSKYNQENLAVMAIVGMGGLGKTTLARSVYNKDSILKFFEKRIWVCVSNPFDVNLILLRMLEDLKLAQGPSKDNQNAILTSLQKELKDKRYLLVLDDVWNEDPGNWEYLMECLSKLNSAQGSKIVVTTRSGKVASISEKLLPPHDLKKLSAEECWSIMKDRAFPNSSADIAPAFQTIGREIAENCGGVPLVAKVLGGILHTKKSIKEWLSFKDSRIWDNLSKGEDKILPVLKLSFDNLESPSLKQCFAYCSVFKKDFEIRRDNLIQLWMAQGLLHPSPAESNQDMEDIGDQYFDILLQSSLFQDATVDDNGTISECKMHDLVHDLAELVSRSEILKGDLRGTDNTLEIRHVARVSTSKLEQIPKGSAGKLRSLFSDDGEVLTNILPRFKALRVLNLSNEANIEEFPVSVGRLKHLRYLDISETRFKALPKSIGKLYNLQTLRAMNCALEEFPKEVQNLINLRHIYFDKSTKFPQGIRRLTHLRTLPYFSVGNEIGRRIEELAGLKQLKGKLIIRNLEYVKNGEEAKKAKLEDKREVSHLKLKWTEDRSITDNNEDEDVLEGLRPHPELKTLIIKNFMGNKFPLWMMSRSLLLNNLKKIMLVGCDKCEVVPPLGHLPNLTELQIRGMTNLKCVGVEFYGYEDLVHNVATTSKEIITLFPALKILYISECGDLIEWMEVLQKKVVVFPCLEELHVKKCSKLRNAPSHFPFLRKLEIISSDSRRPIEEISSGLTTLTSLEIEGIKELTCLPQGMLKKNNNLSSLEITGCVDLTCIAPDVFDCCGSLETLFITDCEKLRHLADGLDTLPLLHFLYIERCPSLELIPITQGMASLRQLYIEGCQQLSRLPSGLEYCTSLQKLWIFNCNNLTSIEIKGGVSLTSLQELLIMVCPKLKSLPNLEFPRLEKLYIGGFWGQLDSFPDFQVGSLMHLTSLKLKGWPKLKSLPQQIQHLTSLTKLVVEEFGGVETLPEWLGSLTSLTDLMILNCKNLMNLPSVQAMQRLTRLRRLLISGCHPLLEQRCRRDSGTDWPKISHIPDITIEVRDELWD